MWLQREDGHLVNLDHCYKVEISQTPDGTSMVVAYPENGQGPVAVHACNEYGSAQDWIVGLADQMRRDGLTVADCTEIDIAATNTVPTGPRAE